MNAHERAPLKWFSKNPSSAGLSFAELGEGGWGSPMIHFFFNVEHIKQSKFLIFNNFPPKVNYHRNEAHHGALLLCRSGNCSHLDCLSKNIFDLFGIFEFPKFSWFFWGKYLDFSDFEKIVDFSRKKRPWLKYSDRWTHMTTILWEMNAHD